MDASVSFSRWQQDEQAVDRYCLTVFWGGSVQAPHLPASTNAHYMGASDVLLLGFPFRKFP